MKTSTGKVKEIIKEAGKGSFLEEIGRTIEESVEVCLENRNIASLPAFRLITNSFQQGRDLWLFSTESSNFRALPRCDVRLSHVSLRLNDFIPEYHV